MLCFPVKNESTRTGETKKYPKNSGDSPPFWTLCGICGGVLDFTGELWYLFFYAKCGNNRFAEGNPIKTG
jgi:hypothetical protein